MTGLIKFLGFNTGPIRTIESIDMSLAWGWAGLLLVLLAVLPLAYYFYRFEGRKLAPQDQKIILGLRVTFILILALVLSGPLLIISGWVPQKNRIAVMIDSSKSMGIKQQGKARIDMVKSVFSDTGFLSKLEDKTGIFPEIFSFADNVSPISRQEIEQFNITADGNQTDISAAAKNIAGNLGEGSMLGLIIMTDGVQPKGENRIVYICKCFRDFQDISCSVEKVFNISND